ncbi:hypothetical protein INR75_09175 [Zunongwangia sp. SCSIO 43204]|uniref:hypothetical protein n=1 Tax=Zunongwangia sp. SCSIO 43204 TaxID=2779359 RepID=UPI001CA8C5EF|nr:hypothetical protein [Zunongwangia sp. SCSIO 43204]UAB86144.1 hypothetical protein INR75_09175 [Zunongwangia sp. SCSIO 43204]
MGQDIRKMLQEDKESRKFKMPEGHQSRFADRLNKAFPEKKKSAGRKWFLQIAAILVVALAAGGFFYFNSGTSVDPYGTQVVETSEENPLEEKEKKTENSAKQFQLSDVSPQYKKIEDYYMASLNMELAKLDVNNENKELIDSFMKQLAELDKEYKRLNNELNELGPNEQTIEAMVANLQLRLELLFKLKQKLKEIKESKDNSYENAQA